MGSIATVDSESRLELPEETRQWFPPGSRFVVLKEGENLILRPVDGLAAHLDKAAAAGNDDELSWDEIDVEIQAHRREKAARNGRP